MTLTVTPRRTAAVVCAVLLLAVAYLLGSSRIGPTAAAAAPATVSVAGSAADGKAPGITVSGTADVAGTPDTLRLDMSVSASASSVSQAMARANGSAAAVQKSLRAHGVAKKDLQTTGLSIQPNYTYPSSGKPTISSYAATESIKATMRDLPKAGDAVSAAVAAGGNAVQVNGLSLDLDDTSSLVSAARDKAYVDAKSKAQQYAKAAGRSLGAAQSITEAVQNPMPQPYGMSGDSASAMKPMSLPIQAGSQNVTVNVTVVFAVG